MSDDLEGLLGRHLRTAAKEFQPDVDAESISSAIRQRLVLRRRRRNTGLMASAAVLVSILMVVLASASAGPAGVRVATSATSDSVSSPTATTVGPPTAPCPSRCHLEPAPSGPARTATTPVSVINRVTTDPGSQTTTANGGPSPSTANTTLPTTPPPSTDTTVPVSISAPPATSWTPPSTLPTISITPTTVGTTTTATTLPPVVILLSDSGQTIQVAVGAVIELRLQSTCPASRWSKIVSTNKSAVAPDGAPSPVSTGLVVAKFLAVGLGSAQLRAAVASTVTCPTPGAASFVITLDVVGI